MIISKSLPSLPLLIFLLEFSWPVDQRYESIPWEEIDDDLEAFVDIEQYTIPGGRLSVDGLSSGAIFALADFLRQVSTSKPTNPFVFRRKEEIMKLKGWVDDEPRFASIPESSGEDMHAGASQEDGVDVVDASV